MSSILLEESLFILIANLFLKLLFVLVILFMCGCDFIHFARIRMDLKHFSMGNRKGACQNLRAGSSFLCTFKCVHTSIQKRKFQ